MLTDIRKMTVAEYFAFDESSELRHEYIDGEIIEMAGGTGNHSAIVAYTIIALGIALEDKDCVVRASDMRVRVDDTKYLYPDVSVVCGDAEFEDENEVILRNPTLVVEVLSPSSMARDLVDKLAFYATVPSIQGYLILDQERAFATWHRRANSGWNTQQFSDLTDEIPLEPLECSIALAQVYRGATIEA